MKALKKYSALLALALALLASQPVRATKTVVLQNTTRQCITSIVIYLDPQGVPVETAAYVVKDAGGSVVRAGSVTLVLSAGVKTTLLSHIDSTILPAVDTAEGL